MILRTTFCSYQTSSSTLCVILCFEELHGVV